MSRPPSPDRDTERWASQPAVLAFIQRVLDHRDLRGRFPKTFTYRASDPELRVLNAFLPEAALRAKSSDRIVVQLSKVAGELEREASDHGRKAEPLEALFDRIAGRRPRNLKDEQTARRSAAVDALKRGFDEGLERAQAGTERHEDHPALAALAGQLADAEAGRGRSPGKRGWPTCVWPPRGSPTRCCWRGARGEPCCAWITCRFGWPATPRPSARMPRTTPA